MCAMPSASSKINMHACCKLARELYCTYISIKIKLLYLNHVAALGQLKLGYIDIH